MKQFESGSFLDLFSDIMHNEYLMIMFFAALSFFVVYRMTPVVIHVAMRKRLSTPINFRSSHTRFVPAFGGASIFMALLFCVALITTIEEHSLGNWLIMSMMVMFCFGLKDDLVPTLPRTKFLGELIAIMIIIVQKDLLIQNLHGFFGIFELGWYWILPFSLFFMVAIVNSYNMIDGIDGLAGSVGIVIACFFSWYFWTVSDVFYLLVSISVIGSISAFLIYNFSNNNRKIFLGDSGSLTIGLIIGVLSLRFVNTPSTVHVDTLILPENKIFVLLFVLIIPVFDTLRVIIIRLMNGKSPFHPDKNHLHHLFLHRGYSHKAATVCISVINIAAIFFVLLVDAYAGYGLMLATAILGYAFMALLARYLKKNKSRIKWMINI